MRGGNGVALDNIRQVGPFCRRQRRRRGAGGARAHRTGGVGTRAARRRRVDADRRPRPGRRARPRRAAGGGARRLRELPGRACDATPQRAAPQARGGRPRRATGRRGRDASSRGSRGGANQGGARAASAVLQQRARACGRSRRRRDPRPRGRAERARRRRGAGGGRLGARGHLRRRRGEPEVVQPPLRRPAAPCPERRRGLAARVGDGGVPLREDKRVADGWQPVTDRRTTTPGRFGWWVSDAFSSLVVAFEVVALLLRRIGCGHFAFIGSLVSRPEEPAAGSPGSVP